MGRKTSANILSYFALNMSVCLLYSCHLKSFTRIGTFGGLTCQNSDIVFQLNNISSDIQCAFHCPRESSCLGVFHNQHKRTCVGCSSINIEDMVPDEGSVMYALESCGEPPAIAYGQVTLDNGASIMDTAIVTCDSRFRASTDKITCKPDGTWETAICEEYDCYLTVPREYKGKRNTTQEGMLCLRWDSDEAVSRGHTDMENYPESTLSEAENFCRSPTTYFYLPWCYVEDQDHIVYSKQCGIDQCE